MFNWIRKSIRTRISVSQIYIFLLAAIIITLFLVQLSSKYFILFMLEILAVFLLIFRPKSMIHQILYERKNLIKTIITILVVVFTILVSVLPMSYIPLWNGEIPDHRNQYELMAENIIDGRLYFDYGDEEQLSKLKNPYDPIERAETGVTYHWDHAYFDGEYYMYFGVVPVFLVFLPYRIITGASLTTYRATQFFVSAIIIGVFVLFRLLSKLFFEKIPFVLYLFLSASFSIMSVWYSIAEPALYCTAITAAISLEIWSLYFFIRAVWYENIENKQIIFAGVGAFLGALVFGCRPTIALSNIIVIPILIVFIKQRKLTVNLMKKLLLAASPYLIVAIALMLYNFVRFDNPFEFGQAYQLTVADQSQYGISLNLESLIKIINNTWVHFLGFSSIVPYFPYLNHSGVFVNFPILLFMFGAFKRSVHHNLLKENLFWVIIGFIIAVLIITAMDILWTPYLIERYKMDIYFLMGIVSYIIIGFLYNTSTLKHKSMINSAVPILSVVTVSSSFLLYLRQIEVYYPEMVIAIERILAVWNY